MQTYSHDCPTYDKTTYYQLHLNNILMETIEKTIRIKKISENELTDQQRIILNEARAATYRSYAPYSNFSVGASVLLDNGEIITGSNQENSALPSGLCAERTAICHAHSCYPETGLKTICIAARNKDGDFTPFPIPPCGACRQVIVESEQRSGHTIELLLYGKEYSYLLESASDLLPLSFSLPPNS